MSSKPKKERRRCYFDITIDGRMAGRVVFELFDDVAPVTCENFLKLCTGEAGIGKNTGQPLHYKGSLFHRVIKNFMIQGGDFTAGNGTGGESIYGGMFDDEEFVFKHDEPYLLSMANKGKNTNGSQFFITTKATPHLDGLHVVFGRVHSGKEVVDEIEHLKVNGKSKPYADVVILTCGQLVKKVSAKRKYSDSEGSEKMDASESDSDDRKKKRSKRPRGSDEENKTESVAAFSTVRAEDLPEEPENQHSFLMRRSKTPEHIRKEREVKKKVEKKQEKSVDRESRKKNGQDRSRSRTPDRRRSRSPIRKRSRSPIRKRSRSPMLRKRSRSPVRKRSRSPVRKRSRSPVRKRSRSPGRKRSRSTDRKRSRSPGRQSKRSTERRRSRSPRRGDRDRYDHRDRRGGRDRSRSRDRRRDRPGDRNERDNGEKKVKVKGRGALRFNAAAFGREKTPPHWRKEEQRLVKFSEFEKQRDAASKVEDIAMKVTSHKEEEASSPAHAGKHSPIRFVREATPEKVELPDDSPERTPEGSPKKAASRSPERSPAKSAKSSPKGSPERSASRSQNGSPKRSPSRSRNGSPEKSASRSPDSLRSRRSASSRASSVASSE
ncbi:hypothetical protein L596_015445 [Steinernema carpocapsae]|uniref:peptidylprolyl isomerase n=1 Tax=Steinernema carpocapsae TaxID=34508 RepID=A0A4U5NF05_STECR|nr:hypothetical protein L596_015445 [Steinernema carpocapsae]